MKKGILILSLLAGIILLMGCQQLPTTVETLPTTTPEPESAPTTPPPLEKVRCEPALQPPQLVNEAPAMEEEMASPPEKIVEITSIAFSPRIITITTGETVTFINKDSSTHWPASNLHPVHTTYPGSNIGKCGTADEKNIFDACRGLLPGEHYSFTFTKKGRWPYHDHLHPNTGGTIVVE